MLSQSVEQVLRLLGLWYAWTVEVDTGVTRKETQENMGARECQSTLAVVDRLSHFWTPGNIIYPEHRITIQYLS